MTQTTEDRNKEIFGEVGVGFHDEVRDPRGVKSILKI